LEKKHCTIIGAGPSLEGFPFHLIKGFKIGINWKITNFVQCDALCAWDFNSASVIAAHDYYRNKLHTLAHFPIPFGQKYEPIHVAKETPINVKQQVINSPNHVLNTTSSGAFALELAYKNGFTDVTMIGFDNKVTVGGKHHFYDEVWVLPDQYERLMNGGIRGNTNAAFHNHAISFGNIAYHMRKTHNVVAVSSELPNKPYGVETYIKGMSMADYLKRLQS